MHLLLHHKFDGCFGFIGQFGAFGRKELHAIIIIGVVRRTNHYTRGRSKGSSQIRNRRRRHGPEQTHIDTSRGKARLKCRFEQISRHPGVLTDYHIAVALISQDLTRSPTQLHNSTSSHWLSANTTSHSVCSEVLSSHGWAPN